MGIFAHAGTAWKAVLRHRLEADATIVGAFSENPKNRNWPA